MAKGFGINGNLGGDGRDSTLEFPEAPSRRMRTDAVLSAVFLATDGGG